MRGQQVRPASARTPFASVWLPDGPPQAAVLILHGGQEVGPEALRSNRPPALRMLPFDWAIRRRSVDRRIAIWRLHYRFRGWNAAQASPVPDARWALREIRRRYGEIPVALLGHSMGGRVAVNVADEPAVRGLVALAPWLPAGESVAAVRDRHVVIVHGERDRVTSPAESLGWAARAETTAASVEVHVLPGAGHAMIRHASRWHRLAARGVLAAVTG